MRRVMNITKKMQRKTRRSNKMLAGLGPTGNGITNVLHYCFQKWHEEGARVLCDIPTGSGPPTMRAKHPYVDVDTCHGAFLFHKELTQALPIMTQYEFIVVDGGLQEGDEVVLNPFAFDVFGPSGFGLKLNSR